VTGCSAGIECILASARISATLLAFGRQIEILLFKASLEDDWNNSNINSNPSHTNTFKNSFL